MEQSIWRKKPMAAYEADIKNNQLKKVLGKWSLTAIGIGGIIGGGIFVLTGTAAHYHAGPALALSFVVAGIGCVFAALSYSEFASMLPRRLCVCVCLRNNWRIICLDYRLGINIRICNGSHDRCR